MNKMALNNQSRSLSHGAELVWQYLRENGAECEQFKGHHCINFDENKLNKVLGIPRANLHLAISELSTSTVKIYHDKRTLWEPIIYSTEVDSDDERNIKFKMIYRPDIYDRVYHERLDKPYLKCLFDFVRGITPNSLN